MASSQRLGRFELADKSSLFLDEVGDMPLELQPKLLRVLQEQEFERLGSNKLIQTDVRLIAATNRDLKKMVADREFRSDLYYRLNVFPICLPPLRERREDIPLLFQHFLLQAAARHGRPVPECDPACTRQLVGYRWPGNVRELRNVLERATLLTEADAIEAAILQQALLATHYRSNLKGFLRSREAMKRAEDLIQTGLTPADVDRLAALDAQKAETPGALLAHWLDENLWREVLDEADGKAKERDLRERRRAAEDPLAGVYGA